MKILNVEYLLELDERLDGLRDVHEIQGRAGNWDNNLYMNGFFNGLELALTIMEGRSPSYRYIAPRLVWEKTSPE